MAVSSISIRHIFSLLWYKKVTFAKLQTFLSEHYKATDKSNDTENESNETEKWFQFMTASWYCFKLTNKNFDQFEKTQN